MTPRSLDRFLLAALAASILAASTPAASVRAAPAGAAPAATSAASGGLDPAVAELVAAERAFARTTLERGVRDGFLAYLADDAVLFRPKPVAGRKWTEERPAPAVVLAWEPLWAEVAASGDLGYTTGPWDIAPQKGAKPDGFGHYVSIWRRADGGSWRVALDLGNHYPGAFRRSAPVTGRTATAATATAATATAATATAATAAAAKGGPASGDAARAALRAAEHDFAGRAESAGERAALEHAAAADLRLYRAGSEPAEGRAAAWTLLGAGGARRRSQLADVAVSRAGDLGYTYGVGERLDAAGKAAGEFAYTRIWRREGDAFRVVLDITID